MPAVAAERYQDVLLLINRIAGLTPMYAAMRKHHDHFLIDCRRHCVVIVQEQVQHWPRISHKHMWPDLLVATSECWLSVAGCGAVFRLASRSSFPGWFSVLWSRSSLQFVNCTFADTKGLVAACLSHKQHDVLGIQKDKPFTCFMPGSWSQAIPVDNAAQVSA